MEWKRIIEALDEAGIKADIASNEPFCDWVRESCPTLGVGLPPAAEEPGGIVKTRQTLEANGVAFIVD